MDWLIAFLDTQAGCYTVIILIGAGYLIKVLRTPMKPIDTSVITFMEHERHSDLKAWDAAVILAAEKGEQRKSGRCLGRPIHVVLRKGASWDVWIYAKWIYYYGAPSGVTIEFEDPFDVPTGESEGRPRDILDRAEREKEYQKRLEEQDRAYYASQYDPHGLAANMTKRWHDECRR